MLSGTSRISNGKVDDNMAETKLQRLIDKHNAKLQEMEILNEEAQALGLKVFEESQTVDEVTLRKAYNTMLDSQTKFDIFVKLKGNRT